MKNEIESGAENMCGFGLRINFLVVSRKGRDEKAHGKIFLWEILGLSSP